MDKTVIKNYAVAARRKLIEAVRQKAYQLYIYEDGALPPDEAYHKLRSDGIFMTPEQSWARGRLCAYLALLGNELDNEKAYQHVMEEVAYTWFNRLIALRFMEVNDYLPSGIRILSSRDEGRAEPDAMCEAERLPYVNQDKIAEYRAATGIDASEKLYKYILISQCNALSDILPGMFEKIDDYTELLLPDALYRKGGIAHDLVHSIDEDNFRDQVQIIGWLYQYYISEKKDEVFAGLKKNIKINKETIPAATQLFTPEWIVRYMVENSLGRVIVSSGQWTVGSIEKLKAGWKYYIEEAEQTDEVRQQLLTNHCSLPTVFSIENVKIIDPCMGSGHILVYAFDVLYQAYEHLGYATRDIPNLILQHNLYGLDIDGRAAQLAYFALMMKARSYNRRFFRQESIPQPHVHAVIESDGARRHHLDYMGHGMSEAEQQQCRDDLTYLMRLFADAREYGSILKINRALDYDRLRRFVNDVLFGQLDIYSAGIDQTERNLLEVLSVAEIMTHMYDVVVTNPPYMGSGGMGGKLSEYVKQNYPDSKSDLFAVLIEKCGQMLNPNGFQAMITQHAWMFLSSYVKLRDKILLRDIVSMAHLGARAFEEISGEVVQTTAFVLRNNNIFEYKATYVRLVNYPSQVAKEEAFLLGVDRFITKQKNFEKIPGMPIAYWVSNALSEVFTHEKISKYAISDGQTKTGNNDKFLRLLWEVDTTKVGKEKKWVFHAKGGSYRRWFGNVDTLIDWSESARQHYRSDHVARIAPEYIWFRTGICWTLIAGGDKFAARILENDSTFNLAAPSIFFDDENLTAYVLGYLNTPIADKIVKLLNPTINTNITDIISQPLIISDNNRICELVHENILISRTDWDSFEISWNFRVHPLVGFKMAGVCAWGDAKSKSMISSAFKEWELLTKDQFAKLKANEEELNRIFIEIYGLQDELTPEVEDKDVTIRKADLSRDIRSFISYAVGCMFGRYSLDEPGLQFAGGEFSGQWAVVSGRYYLKGVLREYGCAELSRTDCLAKKETAHCPLTTAHYGVACDAVLPIGASDYFDDDIVVRFVDFVRVVYGDATLDENLNFIADALYPNGGRSSKEKIRRYFLNDFYKDHVKTYQKRPIYWLFDSGKKDGFKALIYLHRYDKFTVARVRTDYLHPLQRKYESEIGRLEMLSGITENAREKAAYRKEIETLQKRIEECRIYDQVVAHIAHQAIELDLDDGVTVNYAKFQGVEVPKDNGKTVKMDLLAKI
ncbi:MAG: hypothetical protein VR68_03635 [Peptococcaceae bacterium BRH_c4a]|nr:MAG: hypothetical protein VR68_03635 [Peptococcaceae bacterium BRH_c4a]